MRSRRTMRARKWGTILVVVAIVGVVGSAVTSPVNSFTPAFSLTAGKGFAITSTVFETYHAGTCLGYATTKLFPGRTRCLAVTVHNPQSFALLVTSLAMTVPSFSPRRQLQDPTLPACSTTMVSPPSLFTARFAVKAGGNVTIDKPIQLSTDGNQDNCEGGIFTFSFTGSATRAGAGGSDASWDRPGTGHPPGILGQDRLAQRRFMGAPSA